MILTYITLFVALFISAISAWFSIAGLVTLFSGAALAVYIMGAGIEAGKVVATSWLYRNWDISSWSIKAPLCLMLIVLMGLTSMGVYGFLSKAHLEQTAPLADSSLELTNIDQEIEAKEIEVADHKSVISQLDLAVKGLTDANRLRGENGAIAVRKSQKVERDELSSKITTINTQLLELRKKRASISVEQNKINLEVGPIKYVAELFGMKDIGSAVRVTILIIVIVFDPLAILLMIAANSSMVANQQTKEKMINIDTTQSETTTMTEPDKAKTKKPRKSKAEVKTQDVPPTTVEIIDDTQKTEIPPQESLNTNDIDQPMQTVSKTQDTISVPDVKRKVMGWLNLPVRGDSDANNNG